jgi:hypothetical protein
MAKVDISFKLQGYEEFEELMLQIRDDFGPKDANAILKDAVKDAMVPVLMMAKSLAPKHTGALAESLRIEARRPNQRDHRSRYVLETDTMIGTVTTAPGNVLARKKFVNLQHQVVLRNGKKEWKIKQVGIESDARANVQEFGVEFGSHAMAAQPYMRPALQSQGIVAANSLGAKLGSRLEKYKAKQSRKPR